MAEPPTRRSTQRRWLTVIALGYFALLLATCTGSFVKFFVYNDGPPPWLTTTPTFVTIPTNTRERSATPVPPAETPRPTHGVIDSAPTPTTVTFSATERLAYFHEIWQIVDENYVYQDFNGVDWAAVEHGYDDQIRAAQTTTEFYAIVQTAIDLLADDHTRFDTPQQTFEEDAAYTGSAGYAGIGVMLRDLSDSVLVIRIGRNGPADQAGVQIYDRITAVDGRAISDFYAAEDDYGAAVRGEIGTTVTLTIQRGSATLTIPIVRNAIPGDAFPEATAMLIPDTRVQLLTIDSFNREQLGELIVEALAAARPSDGPVSGLIIDVRENGGGEVQAMLDTIGLFADGGSIGSTVGRGSSEELLVDAGNTLDGYGDIPIAVLIGPGTVSAAEMFASGMHSLRGATLVGTTSAGNTENLYPYDFDDGAVLWLAEVLFRQRNGTYVDNVGVTPDIEVPDDTDITDLAHDPALQAALASFP